jgi:ZIP family zinc transporter
VESTGKKLVDINHYRWQKHCRGLFELPAGGTIALLNVKSVYVRDDLYSDKGINQESIDSLVKWEEMVIALLQNMSLLLTVIASTFLAGLAMPLGAVIACFEKVESEWLEQEFRHSVMAFGGGALLSAVALVLVPEGIANLNPLPASIWLIVGGLSFMALDIYLKRMDTPASQLAAMLSDFIPESIALGGAFATGNSNAFLLAALIGLQNLPEGFSAYRELNASSAYRPKNIIIMFSLMAALGPIAAVSGYLWLSESPKIIAAVMLFASGGILYSIFQDLAPQVKLEKHWAPPMGAVFGFTLGMLGLMLTTS